MNRSPRFIGGGIGSVRKAHAEAAKAAEAAAKRAAVAAAIRSVAGAR